MTETTLSLTRDRRITLAGIVGFAVALAAASQVSMPVPGTAVPMTLEPLAVVLAGLWLGPAAGAASMLLFVVAGASGLPVFAPTGLPGLAHLLGPTGGYILAYPLAAFVAGSVARRRRGYAWRVFAAVAGMAVIHLGGLAQLTVLTGSASRAVALGSLPFLGMDLAKSLLAGVLAPSRTDRALA